MLVVLSHTVSEFANLPTAQLVQDCDELCIYLMTFWVDQWELKPCGPRTAFGPYLGYEGYLGLVIWVLQIFSFFCVWLIRGVMACRSTSQVLLSDHRQCVS